MKKKIFIAALIVATVVTTGKLYAQEPNISPDLKMKTKSNIKNNRIKDISNTSMVIKIISTQTGCNIVFDNQEAESKKTTGTKSSFAFAVNTDGGITAEDDWEAPSRARQSKEKKSNLVCGITGHFRQKNKPVAESIDCPFVDGVCTLPLVEDGDYICDIVCSLNSGKEKSINPSFTITILGGQFHSINTKGTGGN